MHCATRSLSSQLKTMLVNNVRIGLLCLTTRKLQCNSSYSSAYIKILFGNAIYRSRVRPQCTVWEYDQKEENMLTVMGPKLEFSWPKTRSQWIWRHQTLKGTCINRNTYVELLGLQIWPKLQPVGWQRKQKKRNLGGRRKLQNRHISLPRVGAILQPICTKFDDFVDLTKLITPAKCGSNKFLAFSRPSGGKGIFL